MSENITHMAVFEDSSRLALHSPRVCDECRYSLLYSWRNNYWIGLVSSFRL